jgi:indolepyruvate ferredoxin oxidoreductase alpha subunit
MGVTVKKEEILLGNGALAWGLLKAGCDFITSYPGTPSSEIVPEAVRFKKALGLDTYIEWSVNEKVAFDVAFAACLTGKRSACVMKQVGLNVAADSLMSAAYLGVVGGMVIISCDDPGPHSSQTEQDTRLFAHFARVPVFDPSSPAEAVEMACAAFDFSERFRIPVILRPAIRVCHARQNISLGELPKRERKSKFEKDPQRWASTPRFRYILHKELNEKHIAMEKAFSDLAPFNAHNLSDMKESGAQYPLGVIAGGVPYANTVDALGTLNLADRVPLLKLGAPYPFPQSLVNEFTTQCDRLLVIEETDSFIELLLGLGDKVIGRGSGHVPTAPRAPGPRALARTRHGHHGPGRGRNRPGTASPPPRTRHWQRP